MRKSLYKFLIVTLITTLIFVVYGLTLRVNAYNGEASISVWTTQSSIVSYKPDPNSSFSSLTKKMKLKYGSKVKLTKGAFLYSCNRGKNSYRVNTAATYQGNELCQGRPTIKGDDQNIKYQNTTLNQPYVISPRVGFLLPDNTTPSIYWKKISDASKYTIYLCYDKQRKDSGNSLLCRDNQELAASPYTVYNGDSIVQEKYASIEYPFPEKLKKDKIYEIFIKATVLRNGKEIDVYSHEKADFEGKIQLINEATYQQEIIPWSDQLKTLPECLEINCLANLYHGHQLYVEAVKVLTPSSQSNDTSVSDLKEIYEEMGLTELAQEL
jgi:hypothetical protein